MQEGPPEIKEEEHILSTFGSISFTGDPSFFLYILKFFILPKTTIFFLKHATSCFSLSLDIITTSPQIMNLTMLECLTLCVPKFMFIFYFVSMHRKHRFKVELCFRSTDSTAGKVLCLLLLFGVPSSIIRNNLEGEQNF